MGFPSWAATSNMVRARSINRAVTPVNRAGSRSGLSKLTLDIWSDQKAFLKLVKGPASSGRASRTSLLSTLFNGYAFRLQSGDNFFDAGHVLYVVRFQR